MKKVQITRHNNSESPPHQVIKTGENKTQIFKFNSSNTPIKFIKKNIDEKYLPEKRFNIRFLTPNKFLNNNRLYPNPSGNNIPHIITKRSTSISQRRSIKKPSYKSNVDSKFDEIFKTNPNEIKSNNSFTETFKPSYQPKNDSSYSESRNETDKFYKNSLLNGINQKESNNSLRQKGLQYNNTRLLGQQKIAITPSYYNRPKSTRRNLSVNRDMNVNIKGDISMKGLSSNLVKKSFTTANSPQNHIETDYSNSEKQSSGPSMLLDSRNIAHKLKNSFQDRQINSYNQKSFAINSISLRSRRTPSYDSNSSYQYSPMKSSIGLNLTRERRSADFGNRRSSRDDIMTKANNDLRYCIRSRAGVLYNGSKKINQDNYLAIMNYGNKNGRYFFAVCDGHGINGHFVSNFVKENLPVYLLSELKSQTDLKLSLINAYGLCNQKLINSNIDSKLSGTTCISILIDGDSIISANVGDSRAIMASYKKGYIIIVESYNIIRTEWEYIQLSNDHKPNDISEAQRILAAGGKIEPFKDLEGNFVGPSRVWLLYQNIPGLAMSRSMGDTVAATVGVTCQPEIKEFKIESDHKFIIIASDGVWEFVKNMDAIGIIAPFYNRGDIEGACDALLARSLKRWTEV